MIVRGLACCMIVSAWLGAGAKVLFAQMSPQDLRHTLDEFHQAHGYPAVFAAVVFDDREPSIAAVGKRKHGDPTPVSADDLIHIGSCTKAMTAVLIARLVEQGKLHWRDSIGDRLPDLSGKIDAGWRTITLEELLSHQSGLPANAKNWWLKRGETIDAIRNNIVIDNLSTAPAVDSRGKFLYSNLGYMVAGHMAARAAGMSWEDAMRQYVLEPLALTSAGFGAPGTHGQVDQPWGHFGGHEGNWLPRQFDNAPALGPAGTIHLSMRDWSRFATVFIGGGPDGFLSDDSLRKLTTPLVNNYALGWGIGERNWAQGITYSHSGSNTMWFCVLWIAPKTGRAYMVVVNCHDNGAREAVDQLVGQIIHLERTGAAPIGRKR